MQVNTRTVSNRRNLRYESLDDLLSDAERVTAEHVHAAGNWSVGQILQHLARTFDASIDGTDLRIPWIVRTGVRLLFNRKRLLTQPLRPGFRIPRKGEGQFLPDADVSPAEGLAALRTAVQRYRTESQRAEHPVFGQLTAEEWDQMHLRHAEMHMSFIVSDSTS